jgi:hypothetical protein
MAKIVPTYVSFEIAKWLKEKGFKEGVNHFYSQSGKLFARKLESGNEPINFEPDDFYENFNSIVCYEAGYNKYEQVFSAPEQYQVVEWLFEEHDIDVTVCGKLPYIVYPESEYGEGELQWHFEYRIIKNKDGQKCEVVEPKEWFENKKDAYLSAFNYIKEHNFI